MIRLLRSEAFRLQRRWMPWVLLLIIAVGAVLVYLLIYTSVNAQLQAIRNGTIPDQPGTRTAIEQTVRQLRPDRVQAFGVSIVNGIGSIMLIVLAASHIGTEFGWGTLRTLLAHGASRSGFFVAKLATLLIFAAVFALVGVVASIAGSYLTAAIGGLETSPGVDLPAVASAAARGVFAFVPYMALAVVFAVWSRSAGAGIAAGLVAYFAESIVAGILVSLNRDFATVVNYGLSRNVASITRVTVGASVGPAEGGAGSVASTLPDQGQAALVLVTYTALFLALAWWRLRARDVTVS